MVFHREQFLGPFYFYYICDLPNCFQHSQPRIYANDTSITFAGSYADEMNNCTNVDLKELVCGLQSTNLLLNMTKTEFSLICSKQRLFKSTARSPAAINQFPINQVSTVKS